MNVRIAASSHDFAIFREMAIEYEDSLPHDLQHAEFEKERSRVNEVYAPPHAAFIAALDGVPCGCVAMVALDESTAIVKKLYVRPSARNRGAGRALMNALVALAGDRRFERLVLDTQKDRLNDAYRLYVSLGFAECAPFADVTYASPTFMELHVSPQVP
jgi:GNAT superfamily N-acetyltransferase